MPYREDVSEISDHTGITVDKLEELLATPDEITGVTEGEMDAWRMRESIRRLQEQITLLHDQLREEQGALEEFYEKYPRARRLHEAHTEMMNA